MPAECRLQALQKQNPHFYSQYFKLLVILCKGTDKAEKEEQRCA